MKPRVNILFILFFAFNLCLLGQNVNYSVTLTELLANGDNNDGGIGINDQDPNWYVWLMDNGTNANSLTTFQATGCIATTNTYGVWWSGTPAHNGPAVPYNWLNVIDADATQLLTEMEGWEEDCNPRCDYEPSPGLFSSCVGNGDDNKDGRGSSGNINFQLDPPCANNAYEIFIGDYRARLEVYWEYTNVDAGIINGDQFVCSGGDPSILGSTSIGTAATSTWFTYQWQQDIGCTGTWSDIAGATSQTYDPPLGIVQNTCYRRNLVSNCGVFSSNSVSVQIETPSTDPSSITANPPTVCGSSAIGLTVNGGVLGTNADWYWYNGDPNGTGVLLAQGQSVSINLPSSTTVYVRAEGNCGNTNTVSQLITVESQSVAPTVVTPTFNTICSGGTVNLVASGGAPGTNALYAWYESDPSIGSPVPLFTSTSATYANVTPFATTTYYVRLEGCDTTATASTTITVNSFSSDPSSIASSSAQICSGTAVNLSVNGGALGTGADWFWYEAGCGAGTPIGNGTNISVTPLSTTTYFVRAEGTCNNTSCAQVTVIVDDNSLDPVSVVVSDPSICPGDVVTLSVIGGSLGTGASWEWYNGACGGLNIGSGSTIALNPSLSSSYYVRAEGACNTTLCANGSVTVEDLSTVATGVTSSANNICPGDAVNLIVNGGSLGAGATWEWYQGSCGGIYLGSGSTLTINPTSTNTYYARAEGNCNTTACESVTVNVNALSTTPASVIASSNSVCPGANVTLTVNGGNLIAGDTWTWYAGGCGAGTSIGTGNSITVSPINNTTYYVRAEGTCGNSNCASTSITMQDLSTDPSNITASATNICAGQNVVLTVNGGTLGTNANWEWYTNSCGGTPIGSGNSISVAPNVSTTYFVRGEGVCGNSNCVSIVISVGAGIADPTSITASSNNICPGDNVDLTVVGATLPNGYQYVWYTGACGAVPIGVGNTISISPNSTETYFVRAVGTCGETACADIEIVVVDGSIEADGILASNNNFCLGGSTNLTVDGGSLVNGAQWVWYENSCGGTQIGTGSTITITPSNSSTYYVRAEGGTCGNTACVDVFISVIETIVHINPFDTICGFAPSFELRGGEPSGGTYSGVGVSSGWFNPSLAGIGVHPIEYIYTAANGCSSTVSTDIVVTETDLQGEIIVEYFSCSQGGTTLTANTTGGNGFLDFEWSDGSFETKVNYASSGTYFYYVRDADGCIAKSEELEVTEEMECIDIPNTFTPNSDGKNDTWNLDFTAYDNSKLLVFSKWGREVLQSEESIVVWDGTSPNGSNLPNGVYYYTLELNNGEITQTGFITLLR